MKKKLGLGRFWLDPRMSMRILMVMSATAIILANLKRDLEVLVARYNAVPDRANFNRVRAIRREIAEVVSR